MFSSRYVNWGISLDELYVLLKVYSAELYLHCLVLDTVHESLSADMVGPVVPVCLKFGPYRRVDKSMIGCQIKKQTLKSRPGNEQTTWPVTSDHIRS